ncbi:F-box protein CPR30-like [Durio zibethinus]|uniref:F-box protein CPR30-like n=1 Tax=Durio zibethinus TaxID=66656 RepID=A0A6P5Y313_DURZI|nr:F-box protein CPR30-like [Durio zibethinus]XP_022734818.1 F-box protein CPR30-like [Durio zibethinus]XP_022734819.1 F-box protein CPR30-like [Durio zibethinus]XP_022734820.1 F-box protein CPR30-like [Durio zibethinus]XP_022734822.1 F-box protein CPR30-like [Durio zibethinus]
METLPQLPEDIIVNILSRLPVKYLIQLKCVSKPWLSLISDPQFAKLHLAQSKKNSISQRVLLISEPLESAACEASDDDLDDASKLIFELKYPAAMKKTPDSVELVNAWLDLGGSCDGLICVVFNDERIFLWNPTIREALELTKLGPFDPKGTFSYGLGYNCSTDDYKVVRVARPSPAVASNETEVEVLELKTNFWRRIQGLKSGIEIEGEGIFLHGALHWLASRQTGPKKFYVIVAFHMVEEKFYVVVPIPDNIKESRHDLLVLGISGDCLCLFDGCGYGTVLEAWLLKEYGVKSSWTRLFSVQRETLQGLEYWGNALCYTKTGKVVIDYDGRKLVWYDPKEKTSKTFTPRNEWVWFQPAVYIESLVSPHCCLLTSRHNDKDI